MKRTLIFALVLALSLSLSFLSSSADNGAWDGTTANAFESGNGFKDDPYIISTASQLALLSGSVASGNPHTGEYFKLSGDITLNVTDELTWYLTAKKWTPIGNPNTAFEGVFDGNGRTVRGICIDSESDCQGLFGVIGENGKVSSLTVASSSISGNVSVGAIAGVNNGTVVDCRNEDAVRAVSDGGGIVGRNNGKIAGCSNLGWVGNKGNNGGIAGRNDGEITDCFNEGTVDGGYLVAGGIAGENRGKIINCYNVGYIASEYGKSGSLVGFNGGGTVESSYFLDRGSDLDTLGTLLTSDQMKEPASFKGFDFDKIWTMDGRSDYLYPELLGYTDFYPENEALPNEPTASSDASDTSDTSTASDDNENGVHAWTIVVIALIAAAVAITVIVVIRKKAK